MLFTGKNHSSLCFMDMTFCKDETHLVIFYSTSSTIEEASVAESSELKLELLVNTSIVLTHPPMQLLRRSQQVWRVQLIFGMWADG